MHSFDWDGLHLVLRLARCGSLLSASRELGISHSTLSRRLAALEEKYGEPLFERRARGLAPTPTAAQIIEVASVMEQEAQRLERDLVGNDVRLEGDLRVTMPDLIARRHGDVLAAFTRRYPGIRLEIVCANATLDLGRREADIALRLSDRPPPHLVGRKLLRMEFALYAAREFLGSDTPPLEALPWLAWDRRMGASVTELWMEEHVPNARVAGVLDNTLIMHEALRQGIGIGFFNCLDGDEDEALVRLRPPEPGFGMDLWALTHPDLRRSARVRCFMDHVHAALVPWRSQYLGLPEDAAVEP